MVAIAPRSSRSGWASAMPDRSSAAAFVLERQLHLGPVGRDLALLDDHVLLDHLRHAQVAQRLGGAFDRGLGGLLPGFAAGADQFDDFVDALGHGCLPDTVSPLQPGAGQREARRRPPELVLCGKAYTASPGAGTAARWRPNPVDNASRQEVIPGIGPRIDPRKARVKIAAIARNRCSACRGAESRT